MKKEYNLIILGGGPGGYVASIRASQLGLKTALVEKEKLGGTCLHKGCIPTKALLRSAEVYQQTKQAAEFGVLTEEVKLDFTKVQERKGKIVSQLHQGVLHLMKKGKIDIYEGFGSIQSSFPEITLSVNGNTLLTSKHLIIATGSRPKTLPGLEIDGEYVLTSDEALQLKQLPASVIIVGGGVIGIEWASMLSDFGVEVVVIEYSKQILPTEDEEIARELTRLLKRKRVKILTEATVLPETLTKNGQVEVTVEHKGERKTFTAEKMLVSVGRAANVNDIGLEHTNVQVGNGVIVTNEFYQTKDERIYAIGDCIGGMQLAHVASFEGIIAVEHIAKQNPQPLNYEAVPKCVYSSPEIASVGLTEKEAKEKGYQAKIGKFSFKVNGKALVYGEANGFCKMVVDAENDDVLGIHLIGPQVTNMISTGVLAKMFDASNLEMARIIHPHPTLSEVFGESALNVYGQAIHS